MDLGSTLVWAMGAGAAFLTAVLLVLALRARLARKKAARLELEATRTLVPEGPADAQRETVDEVRRP